MFLKEEERPVGEPAKVLDDASKLMLKAADLIETRGLCKGVYIDGDAHCIFGALRRAAGLGFERKDIGTTTPALQEADKRLTSILGPVPPWNDVDARTKEEVVAKLRVVALGG